MYIYISYMYCILICVIYIVFDIYVYIHVYIYIYICNINICIYMSYIHTFDNFTKFSKSTVDRVPSFCKGSALQSAALLKKGHGHGIQRNFSEKLFSRTTSAI